VTSEPEVCGCSGISVAGVPFTGHAVSGTEAT
jgi:hypothetical protein